MLTIAGKCWPAFQTQFGFVPCYVNSRLTGRGIPVSCEVDIYGALSEFIGTCISEDAVTLLDINNTVPKDMYKESIEGKFHYTLKDTFMGFHCGNTCSRKLAFCSHEIPVHHGKIPSGRGNSGNPGRRYRTGRHHLLSSAEHRRLQAPRLCGTGRGTSGSNQILRFHRYLRNSGDGKILPSRSDREELTRITEPLLSVITEKHSMKYSNTSVWM